MNKTKYKLPPRLYPSKYSKLKDSSLFPCLSGSEVYTGVCKNNWLWKYHYQALWPQRSLFTIMERDTQTLFLFDVDGTLTAARQVIFNILINNNKPNLSGFSTGNWHSPRNTGKCFSRENWWQRNKPLRQKIIQSAVAVQGLISVPLEVLHSALLKMFTQQLKWKINSCPWNKILKNSTFSEEYLLGAKNISAKSLPHNVLTMF